MAQLFFKYGAMNSGKSIEILKVKHNYEEQGKKTLLLTSALDIRDGIGKVSSRIGISSEAKAVSPKDDIIKIYEDTTVMWTDHFTNPQEFSTTVPRKPHCVLVDEAQFLTEAQVLQLAKIVDDLDIPVMCYGLKNDFQNNLFEGSKALLTYADKIEEIKTICWNCKRKATMNGRFSDGKMVCAGEQVQIGGNESYIPLCRKCYKEELGSDFLK